MPIFLVLNLTKLDAALLSFVSQSNFEAVEATEVKIEAVEANDTSVFRAKENGTTHFYKGTLVQCRTVFYRGRKSGSAKSESSWKVSKSTEERGIH